MLPRKRIERKEMSADGGWKTKIKTIDAKLRGQGREEEKEGVKRERKKGKEKGERKKG